MANYPLAFGWHTDQQTEPSDPPDFTPVTPTLLGGALQRSPAEIIYDSRPNGSSPKPDDPNLTPVAVGDLKCTGGRCVSGGDRGATGMYSYNGQIMCRKCIVWKLGIEEDSPAEQLKALKPFLLGGY